MRSFSLLDYIDSVYQLDGITYNTDSRDDRSWTGYQINIRCGLWDYNSVEDWQDDMPHIHSFVIRDFGRGAPDIIDARIQCHPLDLQSDFDTFSSLNLAYIDGDVVCVTDPHMLLHAVNLLLRQCQKEELILTDDELTEISSLQKYQELFPGESDDDAE